MKVFKFVHDEPVKAGCCNYNVSETFWMADSREEAREEMEAHTEEGREVHGNCANCFADLISSEGYEVKK